MALISTIALISGIATGYQMHSYVLEPQIKKTRSDIIKELQVLLDEQAKEMESMRVWTIPQAWRHSETEADGRMQYYISIPQSKEIIKRDSKYYIPMRTE